jgi:hypothetical protein
MPNLNDSWNTTFSGTPVAPATLTVVGNDGSAGTKICATHSHTWSVTTGVKIKSSGAASASGTLGGTGRLCECYVVDESLADHSLSLIECKVTYDGNDGWTAKPNSSPVGHFTWTIVGDDHSSDAKHTHHK